MTSQTTCPLPASDSTRTSLVRFALAALAAALAALLGPVRPTSAAEPGCRVVITGKQVELHSPAMVYRLDASAGLRARGWTNRLTGTTISLGDGAELEADVGESAEAARGATFTVVKTPAPASAAEGEARFELASSAAQLSATVTYRWNAREPVLRKFVRITNAGKQATRILNVRLGAYRPSLPAVEREQGFPVYLGGEFFMSLAHPAGQATATSGAVSLRHYPAAKLAPGGSFDCMEAVYGVGRAGAARATFVAHVRSRMRRVVRGHDRPYAIFDNFGAWPSGNFENSEAYVLHNLALLEKSQKATGCRFDYCSIDFWVDPAGDLKQWDPKRFPNGIARIKPVLDRMGVVPGLWIDSSSTWAGGWTIGLNPAAKPSISHNPGFFCRASEPIRTMYREAFLQHLTRGGIGAVKFDNLSTVCDNPRHDHLPGPYSTEAIENSVIEFLHELDRVRPDAFLILYWGYRSPWWLLHGDTLFDSGIGIEAASPSTQPAPRARDSVTQKLDQAQWHTSDVPWLGKDSLGIWLSSWGWNSSIGKERWQSGVVMDISRGSLLAQIWADNDWLSPPEWQELADLVALLRAQPGCFDNSRFILGNPLKDEPYGYCCTDGRRAFLALNNCTWQDRTLPLELNPAWGLPDGGRWRLVRWYPKPAELTTDGGAFGPKASIRLRPFEIVLLEVVPQGQRPSLDRPLPACPIPLAFAEPSRDVALRIDTPGDDAAAKEKQYAAIWTVLKPARVASSAGATLTLENDGSIFAGGPVKTPETYTIAAETKLTGITGVRLECLADPRLPAHGPGRVYNGNFALSELRVTAAPLDRPQPVPQHVVLHKPAASYSQTSFGGFPVAAALDGDPKTAWSIHPRTGMSHAAVFETVQPQGFVGGTRLVFTLDQNHGNGPPEHAIGRFRLSVTTAKPPLPPPPSKDVKPLRILAQCPASTRGGTFVVTAELSQQGKPAEFRDIGTHFSAEATLSGRPAPCQPVLGQATYPSCWQAWRVTAPPSTSPQPLELTVRLSLPEAVKPTFRGHFLPAE